MVEPELLICRQRIVSWIGRCVIRSNGHCDPQWE